MWNYFLNWMGPINQNFIEKHGNQWSAGRIDANCDDENDPDYNHYGIEVSVPYMHSEDWSRFGEWLDKLKTDRLWTISELVEEYECDTKSKIRWLNISNNNN